MKAIVTNTEPDTELKARFANDVWPLMDVLARGARRLTHNEVDAEDLLQETLLHAYVGFHTFQEGTNLKAWLFRILHNQWINAHRWKERRPAELLSEGITDRDLVAYAAHTSYGLRSAESEVLDTLPVTEIHAAMSGLSQAHRTVLYYAAVEGYTYAETAAIMDIPIGTVMSRVSRARTALRRTLADKDCARGRFVATAQLAA